MLLAASTALLVAFHAPAPLAAPRSSSSRAAVAPVCVLDDQTLGLIAGAAVAAAAGGAYYMQTKNAATESTTAPVAAPAAPAPAPAAKGKADKWPAKGGSSGPHRGAGRWAPSPPIERWVPP